MSLGLSLALVPLLIAMNAFFVAAEYALVAARQYQIEALRARGKRKTAAALADLKQNPTSSIGAIQVCITMTNLLLGWIGEPAMSALLAIPFAPLIAKWPELFTGVSVALSFIVVTLLTVVLSEMLPKALTLRFVTPVATLTAVPMRAIKQVIRPLVWVMNTLADTVTRLMGLGRVTEMEEQSASTEELMMLTRQAASDGVLSDRERSIILNTLALGRQTAEHVMVPRVHVAYFDLRRTMEENRRIANERLFSWMPLCDGGMDHVIGIVPVKEFLAAYYGQGDSPVLSLIARKATFVPWKMSIDKLVSTLLQSDSRMVVVVDEHGGVDGIVTLDDVVHELFGLAGQKAKRAGRTSTPAPAAVSTEGAVSIHIAGDTPIREAAALIGRDGWGASESAITVSGLLLQKLRRFPKPHEFIDFEGIRIRVEECFGAIVKQVELERLEVEAMPVPSPQH